MGLIVFAAGVVTVLTVLYVAYFRSGGTIQAATTDRPKQPYTAQQDDLAPFFDDYQPDTRTDFQRTVDAGYVETPEAFAQRLNAIRAAGQAGNDAFDRSVRRTTIRMIHTRGEL